MNIIPHPTTHGQRSCNRKRWTLCLPDPEITVQVSHCHFRQTWEDVLSPLGPRGVLGLRDSNQKGLKILRLFEESFLPLISDPEYCWIQHGEDNTSFLKKLFNWNPAASSQQLRRNPSISWLQLRCTTEPVPSWLPAWSWLYLGSCGPKWWQCGPLPSAADGVWEPVAAVQFNSSPFEANL